MRMRSTRKCGSEKKKNEKRVLDYIGVHELNNVLSEMADAESSRDDAPINFIRQVSKIQSTLSNEKELSSEKFSMIAKSLEDMSTYTHLSVKTHATIAVIANYARKIRGA